MELKLRKEGGCRVIELNEDEHLSMALVKFNDFHDEMKKFMSQYGDSLDKEVFPKFSYCLMLLRTVWLCLYDAEGE